MTGTKNGFTFLEIIIILLILGILVVAAVPIFVNLYQQAIIAAEDYQVGNINTNLELQRLEQEASGG